MSARYVLTVPARNDIREIVFGVDDRFGRAVAVRVYESIHETLGRLEDRAARVVRRMVLKEYVLYSFFTEFSCSSLATATTAFAS